MNPDHLPLLRCPQTKRPLTLENAVYRDGRVESGRLVTAMVSGPSYPIRDFIPRFVETESYTENFGLEWHIHSRTQYDASSGLDVSRKRFKEETRWPDDLTGELVLEPGSGSGRFTEQVLATGATVVSFDYSKAIEDNYRSNGFHPDLLLVQASITEMPFAEGQFDKVMCLGVLQHTPDPRRSFHCLTRMLKPGGSLVSDIYLKSLSRYYLNTRYWVRPLTRTMDPRTLYRATKAYIDFMWPLARLLRRIPRFGEMLNWRLLIADYSSQLPGASDQTLKEWAYLDTFDMLSPRYDQPQTLETFRAWHLAEGLTEIDVCYGYNGIEGRARRPAPALARAERSGWFCSAL